MIKIGNRRNESCYDPFATANFINICKMRKLGIYYLKNVGAESPTFFLQEKGYERPIRKVPRMRNFYESPSRSRFN